MLNRLFSWFKAKQEEKKLENWFEVTWDSEYIYRNVSPPGKDAWSDKFQWADIERICFEATDYLFSDDIYFFTSAEPESYVIPIEAKGGSELWNLLLEKKLFDPELALKANVSVSGMFCWPEESK